LNKAEWTELDQFLRKYNRALLGKLAIEQEKLRLEQEQKDLKSILKQYLDGITVNSMLIDYFLILSLTFSNCFSF
jgi:hypothetical protein